MGNRSFGERQFGQRNNGDPIGMANSNAKSIDIGRQQIGKVYATALLRACHDNIDSVLDELESLLDDVIDRLPSFEAMIGSPRISSTEMAGLLDRVLSGKVSPDLLKFLKVVCRHERLDCLRYIQIEACRLRNAERNILQFEMTTSLPASDSQARSVAEQLKSKFGADIELDTSVDPSILGGVVIRHGDTVYDASIARRLEMFCETSVANTATAFRDRTQEFASE